MIPEAEPLADPARIRQKRWLQRFWPLQRKHLRNAAIMGLVLLCLFGLWLWPQTELIAPPATALYVDREGTLLCESDAELQGAWDIVPGTETRVAAALIAIEDKRFAQHGGVDFYALGRAIHNNFSGGSRQGASTIAMQVARLQHQGHGRDYLRKLKEVFIAKVLIWRHGHDAVLRHYLKIVPQGNQFVGVSYAARRYFQKPLTDLSWGEAAILAALPKAPGRMNLYRASGRRAAAERANRILHLLHEEGKISGDMLTQALDQVEHLKMPPREIRPYNAYHAILRLNQLPCAANYTGPVYTSLDLKLQRLIEGQVGQGIRDLRRREAGNIASVLLDRKTGAVLAYIGSDFYEDEEHAGSIDFANTPRSSGSTLKPFIYAQGLETGAFMPNSILDDLPFQITEEHSQYIANNYDSAYLGPMLYRQALATSRNIPALSVLRAVGVAKAHERLLKLGLGDNSLGPGYYGLGLAIGGMYVTLEDLVAAYGCLTNDGHRFEPKWLLEGPGGPADDSIFPAAVARQVTLFLADPAARMPIFSNLNFPFPVAIKTGTSQGFRDAWAVAASDRYLLGMWVGRPDNGPMRQVGGADVANLVRRALLLLQPDQARSINEQPFPEPEGYEAAEICSLSGGLASEQCHEPTRELFPAGKTPKVASSVHKMFLVDRVTGLQVTPQTKPEDVVARYYTVLPPRFATWGMSHGYGAPLVKQDTVIETSIAVQAPIMGGRFHLDPDLPRKFQTLALAATVQPAVAEVVWYVDDQPYQRAGYPYQVRWPMEPGEHAIQVRFPNADIASERVTITVQ